MTKHIGIVGCSSEGAALCYQTICLEAGHILGAYAHPEVSMHTHSLARYVECLRHHDLDGVAALMCSSAEKLVGMGAEVLVCPDNTIHQAFPLLEGRIDRPWLHIARVVAGRASALGFQNLGLLGTTWLVESDVYPSALEQYGLRCMRPHAGEIERVGAVIMEELVAGFVKPESLRFLEGVIRSLKRRGCDAVVLGCTELPLVLNERNSELPTLDSTRLLARAAVDFAVGRG
jgi:aspartate racemase